MASSTAVPGAPAQPRMNDLPSEIVHITEGYIPLSRLLTRLAQQSQNLLESKIMELANMPVPSAAATNGHSPHTGGRTGNVSPENVMKKAALLQFAQDMHAQWVKALVITDWSRNAEMVSKLVDLKFHLDQQRIKFDTVLDTMINFKRNLAFAQIPAPDTKTAFQVLSTGSGSFMPDMNYVKPPPLSPEEVNSWIREIDTLLSLRLNVTDYDKIPPQLRDFSISSGRATFRVKDEFEVDLTIADEDCDAQLWFIDFRFAFAPAANTLPDSVRSYLELFANKALEDDGLVGCYNFLHEFVLTHKINELKRQAIALARGIWAKSLWVEPLQRALAIQYWASQFPPEAKAPKHWLLIGVDSGQADINQPDPAVSSRLVVKWYRDGKEVPGADIRLDLGNLSVEEMLRDVVNKHIYYILSSIHAKFAATARIKTMEPGGDLFLSPPATMPEDNMAFSIRAGPEDRITVVVEPISGRIKLLPQNSLFTPINRRISMCINPAERLMEPIEHARWRYIHDDMSRRSSSCGWFQSRPPLPTDMIRTELKFRSPYCTRFFRRRGWHPSWFLLSLLSTSEDGWWVGQVFGNYKAFWKLGMFSGQSCFDKGFWNDVAVMATGVMSQHITRRELLKRRVSVDMDSSPSPRVEAVPGLANRLAVPVLLIRLSELIPSLAFKMRTSADISVSTAHSTTSSSQDMIIKPDSDTLGMSQLELASPSEPAKLIDTKAITSQPSPAVPSAAAHVQMGPWILDAVRVVFQGIQPPPRPAVIKTPSLIQCVSRVTIRVLNPSLFAFISRKPLGNDVVYSLHNGEFIFCICHEVGSTMLDSIISRVKAVDRLVGFIEAMRNLPPDIRYTGITLDQVTFTYPDTRTAPAATAAPVRWPLTIDLSRETIRIGLDPEDPHAPLTDSLSSLANSNNGVAALMKWLPVTLDLCAAFSSIIHSWSEYVSSPSFTPMPPSPSLLSPPPPPLLTQTPMLKTKKQLKQQQQPLLLLLPPTARRHPSVSIEVNSLDWLALRYDITLISGVCQTIRLHARIRYRDAQPWWHISHVTSGNINSNSNSNGNGNGNGNVSSDMDASLVAALKTACNATGVSFTALGTAVAARPGQAAADMVLTLDKAIRSVAKQAPEHYICGSHA